MHYEVPEGGVTMISLGDRRSTNHIAHVGKQRNWYQKDDYMRVLLLGICLHFNTRLSSFVFVICFKLICT